MKYYKAKRILWNSPAALALGIMILSSSCGKEASPSVDPIQQRLEQLTGSWSTHSVVNETVDITDWYTDFILRITEDKSFSVENGGTTWPGNGTFDFIDDNPDLLSRNDDVEIEIISINNNSFTLSLTINSVESRHSGFNGNFTFFLNNITNE